MYWRIASGHVEDERIQIDLINLEANQSTYIPIETTHRLENPGTDPLVLIKVQCGDYLGEDDIVRFDDRYGRQ